MIEELDATATLESPEPFVDFTEVWNRTLGASSEPPSPPEPTDTRESDDDALRRMAGIVAALEEKLTAMESVRPAKRSPESEFAIRILQSIRYGAPSEPPSDPEPQP